MIPMRKMGSTGFGLQAGRAGSIIEVARIEGKVFKIMKEAEAHGLEFRKRSFSS